MKKLIFGFVCMSLVLALVSCGPDLSSIKDPVPLMIKMYSSDHAIGKMMPSIRQTTNSSDGSTSGFFILGTGSYQTKGSTMTITTEKTIEFWWNFQGDDYMYSVIPLKDVVLRLNSKQDTPTVSFALRETLLKNDFEWCLHQGEADNCQKEISSWMNGEANCLDPQIFFKKYLYKVVITVNPKDWPVSIQLPGNSKKL